MSDAPRGIPAVTYVRVLSDLAQQGSGDIIADGHSITILEPGQPSTRHDSAIVLEKGLSDQEVSLKMKMMI